MTRTRGPLPAGADGGAGADYSRARSWVRALPPLPSRIRYLDEYDDTTRSVLAPASSDVWTIRADTRGHFMHFKGFEDTDAKLVAKHHACWCLTECSTSTASRSVRGIEKLTLVKGARWLLQALQLPIPGWTEVWNAEVLASHERGEPEAIKSLLYFFCAMSLGDWSERYLGFVKTLRWPTLHNRSKTIIDGSAIPTSYEESLIIEYLDTVSLQVETGESVQPESLLSHCLLCICYEHALRPIQIGRIDLMNLRIYEGDDGHPVVHFIAFRAKKTDAKDKIPFMRKIKREWGAPFAAWRSLRMAELQTAGRAPTPSDKFFPLQLNEIIKRVGDTVERVTGIRRTATELRHGAAQRLVDAGASVEEVAHFLGHSHWDTSLVYFDASAAQGPNINKALAASPIYNRIVDVARNGYIDRAGLEATEGEKQVGAVPHGIPISGIGACNLGQSLCTLNPAMSCYTCRRFIPIDEADVHRQVLSDFRGVVRFFYDESRGERQSPAFMQLRITLDAVQKIIADLVTDAGQGEP